MAKNPTVRRYEAADAPRWNEFISQARNATFLYNRGFMDYHADRFEDYSLIIADGDKWLAVLPSHRQENVVLSHWGLTYGGLVYDDLRLPDVIEIFREVLTFLNRAQIETFKVKLIPGIYCARPSDDLAYALFLADAKLIRRDSLSVLDLSRPINFEKDRRRTIRRGASRGLRIVEEALFEPFWNQVLIPNLQHKHGVGPVHSLEEISLLHSRFPENIRHFNVYQGDKIVAGTTVFESGNVAHPQYVSVNENKNNHDALDFLYHFLVTEAFAHKRFFDFGISNEQQGTKVNRGLIFWKESFGASTAVQDFYEVGTQNHHLLNHVMI